MMNSTAEELSKEIIKEEVIDTDTNETSEDLMRAAVEEQLKKARRQGLLIGAQATCRVILDKIIAFKSKQGKPTVNDYKRLIRDIEKFCLTGVSRKVNADGETEPIEDTVASKTVQN